MLVRLYHKRMMIEHVFKHGKERLNLDNFRWRGVAKARAALMGLYLLHVYIATCTLRGEHHAGTSLAYS